MKKKMIWIAMVSWFCMALFSLYCADKALAGTSYNQDILISSTKLDNSNSKLELEYFINELNLEPDYLSFEKYTFGSDLNEWEEIPDTSIFTFDFKDKQPEYYMLKTGNIEGVPETHFLFKNEDLLQYAVLNILDLGPIKNIDKISHLSYVTSGFSNINNDDSASHAPEPSTLLLFGVGLLVMAKVQRRVT